jgi:acetyl-CoA acyltransferase
VRFKVLEQAYIIEAIRSPVAKAKGQFASMRPDDLMSFILKSLIERQATIDPRLIQEVIIGCAMPEGEQGMNVARLASLLAGYPDTVPAMTVNRFCASGLEAVALAAHRIQLGEAQLMVAGGIESMTRVPMGGYHYRPSPQVFENKENLGIAFSMGITAEKVAQKWEISRQAQDEFALKSHQSAIAAIKKGAFDQEIIPVMIEKSIVDPSMMHCSKQNMLVSHDQGPRENSTIESLAGLRPVFAAKGSVTAGNTSQMSDGAGAVLLASGAFIKEHNITPIARFCGYAVAGVRPEFMGIGPIEAVPLALKKAGISLAELDWIELNEAFAAQSLAVIQTLGLDPTKVNPNGGAIALGHPLGATGAIRTATLVHGLRNTHKRYGMVTMCIGTGMGAAGIFEAL